MQRFELQEYLEARCWQLDRESDRFTIGLSLHGHTNGKMCDGCPKFDKGNCKSYKILSLAKTLTSNSVSTETVKQEAARLGISIGEVRRRRNALTSEAT